MLKFRSIWITWIEVPDNVKGVQVHVSQRHLVGKVLRQVRAAVRKGLQRKTSAIIQPFSPSEMSPELNT